MKPILPKGPGVPQLHGFLSSSRAAIILGPPVAPAFNLGTPLSSSLLLPAPSTSTITLSAHRVPQPTPVILPLSKTASPTNNVQLQCPLLAPKNYPSKVEDQQSMDNCCKGKKVHQKRKCCRKQKPKEKIIHIKKKITGSETPILPKCSLPEPHTVLLVSTTALGRRPGCPPPMSSASRCSPVGGVEKMKKESKKNKETDNSKDNSRNLIELKSVIKDNLIVDKNSAQVISKSRNQIKISGTKIKKRKNTSKLVVVVTNEETKIKHSDRHIESERRGESSLSAKESADAPYPTESLMLSSVGCLDIPSHLPHQQGIPHHPPPPYPQDTTVRNINSDVQSIKTCKGQSVDKTVRSISAIAAGVHNPYVVRKRTSWKYKRQSVTESHSPVSNSVSVTELKLSSTLNPNSGVDDTHISQSLSSGYSQQCLTTTSATSLSTSLVTVGKSASIMTTVTSSSLSFATHVHSSKVKPVLKSNSTSKDPSSYQSDLSLPVSPRTSFDGTQTVPFSPAKPQNKTPLCSYLSSTSSAGVSLSGALPNSPLPSGMSYTYSISHGHHSTSCLQTPSTLTHSPQSSGCSLPYTQAISHTHYSPSSTHMSSITTHLPQSSASTLASVYTDANEAFSTNLVYSPNISLSSSGSVLCESKSTSSSTSHMSDPFTPGTQHTHSCLSPHLSTCDQTQGSAFYPQAPQCNQSLHPVLHRPSSEANFNNTSSFSSYHMSSHGLSDQTSMHKMTSHTCTYTDSPHPSPYAQALQPTPYLQSPHPPSYTQSPQPGSYSQSPQPTSYSQSPQPASYPQSPQPASYSQSPQAASHSQSPLSKSYTQSSQSAYVLSPQLPPYTQSSRTLLYSHSTQIALNTMLDHTDSSYVHSPQSAICSHSPHPSYTQVMHSNSCMDAEEHTPYPQPTQSLSLSKETQNDKGNRNQLSPQALPFSSGYTHSYCPSPQGEPHSQSSQTPQVPVESMSADVMFRDKSQSPVPPPYSASHELSTSSSSSQYYTNPSSMSYTPEQTSISHDSHYYSCVKFKSVASSSSLDVTSSNFVSLERSLSPPSYEAHLQSTASYITSDSSAEVTHSDKQHIPHQTSPTNYSLSYNIVKNQELTPLHTDAKRGDTSTCPPSPSSSLLPPPPPPRYTCKQQKSPGEPHIDHSIIADIAQGSYGYGTEESPQTYFPPTHHSASFPPSVESHHIQLPDTEKYCASRSDNTDICITSQDVPSNTEVQPRLQGSQNRPVKQERQYRGSNWSSTTRGTAGHRENLKVHSMIERAEKLWFIPHQEQNRVYMKRKELARNLLSDPGLLSSRDSMLKEKFWIEEDEPIAEEILSSLPSDPQQEVGAATTHTPQKTTSKTEKTRELLCQICGKMLKGRSSLKSHMNSHLNIQPHSCPTCAKRFTSRSVLVAHLRTHTGETPYSCSLCDTVFRTYSSLKRHGSIHTTARPYECFMCSKTFKTKLVLQQHMKLHLTDLFTCPDCGKTFEKRKSMAVHRTFHHHKSQRFECPHCPKSYHFRSLLKQHMQLHSNVRKHVCSVCGESFVWRSGLAAHMKTHSASRPQCDVCGDRFASEKRLKSHYRRHGNPQPHQCKVCGRKFSHAYRLVSHFLIHQKHKEYTCQKCAVVFTSAKKFRKHLVTHKKEERRICRLTGTVEVPKSLS